MDYKKRGETELSLTKTDSTYTCRSQYKEDGNDFIREVYRINRYSGRAEYEMIMSRRFEVVDIFQCEKSEKKF